MADREAPQPPSSPKVAVAVVSWNTRELLAACLGSLKPAADSGLAEVWVCDNASSDGSAEMVAERFGWVRLIASEENLGFGRAVNLVAERSSSPWIAAANADIELTEGALEAMLGAGAAPAVGAVAPRLVLADGSTQHSVHPFPTLTLAVVFGLGLHRLSRRLADRLALEGSWDPERPRTVDWAHGAFLLLRREAFERVGGFDPEQWMYAEDLDLCWRLRRAGLLTRYEPAARVHHAVSAATEQAFGSEKAARHIAASYAWMRKRRGGAVTRATAAANLAGAVLRFVLLAAAARVNPRRWKPRRDMARHYVSLHRLGLRRGD